MTEEEIGWLKSEAERQRSEIGGQRSEIGRRTEDRSRRSRSPRSEVRDGNTEIGGRSGKKKNRGQMSEGGKTEIGWLKSEAKIQRSEVRCLKRKYRDQRAEDRSRRLVSYFMWINNIQPDNTFKIFNITCDQRTIFL